MNILIFLLLSLFPSWVFAQGTPPIPNNTDISLFTPAANDLSLKYLGAIFGYMEGGVLHSGGSQLLGTMFGVFNSAILTLGGIVLMYTLIAGTLKTAHEGQVLGQKWDSIWIPIRSVMGFAFIVPKASGYCFIQILVMWIVIQGIGAADAVWDAALNYLGRGGSIIQTVVQSQQQPAIGQILSGPGGLNSVAGNTLRSMVCMYGIQNSIKYNPVSPASQPISDFGTTLTPVCSTVTQQDPSGKTNNVITATSCTISFPGHINVGDGAGDRFGQCGSVSWYATPDGGGAAGNNAAGGGNQVANSSNSPPSDSRSMAVQRFITDLMPISQSIANALITSGHQPITSSQITALFSPTGGSLANQLYYSAIDYSGVIQPYLKQIAVSNLNTLTQFITNAQQSGWILAGSYYWNLTQLNQALSSSGGASADQQPVNAPQPWLADNWNPNIDPIDKNNLLATLNDQNKLVGSGVHNNASMIGCPFVTPTACPVNDPNNNLYNAPLSCYICNEMYTAAFAGQGQGSAVNMSTYIPTPGITLPAWLSALMLTSPMVEDFWDLFQDYINLIDTVKSIPTFLNAGNNNIDPIIGLATVGNNILTDIENMWLQGSLTLLVGSLAAFAASAVNPIGYSVFTAIVWILPLLTIILLSLVAVGATLGYFIPMLPFIIFLFTALGWFIAVIEAMIAAPLVALGIAHPEGHDLLGKAEVAVMLIANVFLRPALIVFGLFIAIILSHVGLWLLGAGVSNLVSGVSGGQLSLPNITSGSATLTSYAITIILFIFILQIVTYSMTAIHRFPNYVSEWIGGPVRNYGEEHVAEAAKAAIGGAAEAAHSAGGQITREIGSHDTAAGLGKEFGDWRRSKGNNKKDKHTAELK